MTSDRKIRANRANARASSGPKTAAGKAQSAQNAFRHGFNVPIWRDPDLVSDVEALAQRIVGKGADANVLELARCVAEAQIDLRRIRFHRHRLIERVVLDPKVQAGAAEPPPVAPANAPVGGARLKASPSDDRDWILGADPLEADVSVRLVVFAKNLAALDRSTRPLKLSLAKLAGEFAALDRYERRALSRRKFAIRAFDVACVEAERRVGDGEAARSGVGEAMEG
ncbi:MAG TPA: hypothetical protein VIF02_08415, partial [Methylocella sp.]